MDELNKPEVFQGLCCRHRAVADSWWLFEGLAMLIHAEYYIICKAICMDCHGVFRSCSAHSILTSSAEVYELMHRSCRGSCRRHPDKRYHTRQGCASLKTA